MAKLSPSTQISGACACMCEPPMGDTKRVGTNMDHLNPISINLCSPSGCSELDPAFGAKRGTSSPRPTEYEIPNLILLHKSESEDWKHHAATREAWCSKLFHTCCFTLVLFRSYCTIPFGSEILACKWKSNHFRLWLENLWFAFKISGTINN